MYYHSKIESKSKNKIAEVRKPNTVAPKITLPYQAGLYATNVQLQRALGNQAIINLKKHQGESTYQVKPTDGKSNDRNLVEPSQFRPSVIKVNQSAKANRVMRLPAEPYVRKINVNLDTSQSVSLEWQGTPPEYARSTFRCSTGKGYGDPDDPPGICNRSCCTSGVNLCEPPYDQRRSRGSCCTPVGNFVIQHKDREHEVSGGTIPFWMYFYRTRGIAIHEYSPVDGTPISHGCVRLDSVNAEMLFNHSHANVTRVSVSGTATPACPSTRACSTSAAVGLPEDGKRFASAGQDEVDQAV